MESQRLDKQLISGHIKNRLPPLKTSTKYTLTLTINCWNFPIECLLPVPKQNTDSKFDFKLVQAQKNEFMETLELLKQKQLNKSKYIKLQLKKSLNNHIY